MCGFQRPAVSATQPLSASRPDISAIDSRLNQLQGIALSSAYAQQKASLKKELSAFLCSLPGNRNLFSATPKDVCRFLAWKDSRGKTQVHVTSCPNLGKHNVHVVALLASPLPPWTPILRAIFNDSGREGDLNTALALGNPAASVEVHNYLKTFSSEQLQASVTPKQATLLFLSKLFYPFCFIQGKMSSPGITAS